MCGNVYQKAYLENFTPKFRLFMQVQILSSSSHSPGGYRYNTSLQCTWLDASSKRRVAWAVTRNLVHILFQITSGLSFSTVQLLALSALELHIFKKNSERFRRPLEPLESFLQTGWRVENQYLIEGKAVITRLHIYINEKKSEWLHCYDGPCLLHAPDQTTGKSEATRSLALLTACMSVGQCGSSWWKLHQ